MKVCKGQCLPEASAVGVFAGYLSLKHRLLLLDKTTENDSYISVRISSVA